MAGLFSLVGAVDSPEASATEGGPYECRACGAVYGVQYFVCPDCGSFGVDPAADVHGTH